MEWLFLLLPIATFSGWIIARNHYKKRHDNNASYLKPQYFKGLNYLLDEQPDKAIDVFVRLLKAESETVEIHMALANLFRRRGETDRAIRIHQNVMAKPSLKSEERSQALVELGLDYMSAGMLDRAEQLFTKLLSESAAPPAKAYEQLLRIYQQEKKWQQAIDIAKKMQTQSGKSIGTIVAQFYCELAEQQLVTSPKNAMTLLKKADAYDNTCIRATLLQADILMNTNQVDKAIQSLLHVEKQNIDYIPETLPKLLECYRQIDKLPVFADWLSHILNHHPTMTSVRLMLTHVVQLQHGNQAAEDYLYKEIHRYPSVEGLHSLIKLMEQSGSILTPLIKDVTHTLLQQGQQQCYICQNCGFSGKTLHWQCPSCKNWSTIKSTEIHHARSALLEASQ